MIIRTEYRHSSVVREFLTTEKSTEFIRVKPAEFKKNKPVTVFMDVRHA